MKAFLTTVAFMFAAPSGALADCDPEAAREISERHMAAALSADCEGRLTDLSAPPTWILECRRSLQGPNIDAKIEFARRTTFRFSRLRNSGPNWMAVGILQGPDPAAVESVLSSQIFCDAAWTSYRPEGQKCGVDWSSIPVKEREGGVPLACEHNQWMVIDLE
jgi:hypothetical protein